jgi:hypothetical protein
MNELNLLYYHFKHIFTYVWNEKNMLNQQFGLKIIGNSYEIVFNFCSLFHKNEYSWNSESKQKCLIKFQQNIHLSKRNKFTICTWISINKFKNHLNENFSWNEVKIKWNYFYEYSWTKIKIKTDIISLIN